MSDLSEPIRLVAEALWKSRFPKLQKMIEDDKFDTDLAEVGFHPDRDEWAVEQAKVAVEALGLIEERGTFYDKIRLDDNTRDMERTHVRYVTAWQEIQ